MSRRIRPLVHRLLEPACVALCLLLGPAPRASAAGELHTFELRDGGRLEYAELLPPVYRRETRYPLLLALPPGSQTRSMVERALGLYWSKVAAHGWIVVSPAAPGGRLFFRGSERTIPELLDHLARTHALEGDRVYLAGVSNGGRSAFRIATLYPERFAALVALPGFPPEAGDFARLERIRALPIALFGDSLDRRWVEQMERTRDRLRELGGRVTLTVYPGEGHVPASLSGGEVLLRTLESQRLERRNRGHRE
ncbi:MAG: hypothetical protein ACE5IL_00005 [Myxococcota bacterium]